MNPWNIFFETLKEKEYGKHLFSFIEKEYNDHVCFPPKDLIFNAFNKTPLENVKVVIVGQDPYHEKGQAMGLCFSVPEGIGIPPSLINIQKEIANEYPNALFFNGDLTYLANQGCLLLNAILTVRQGEPLSHNIKEYQLLLKDVIAEIEKENRTIVYLLWGGNARKLKPFITNPKHIILEANHPSPLSANRGGWFNNGHFKKVNEIFKSQNITEIDWTNSN